MKKQIQIRNEADIIISCGRTVDNDGNIYHNEVVENGEGDIIYRIYGEDGKQYIQYEGEEPEEIDEDFQSPYRTNELWKEKQNELTFFSDDGVFESILKICRKYGGDCDEIDIDEEGEKIGDDESNWIWTEKKNAYGGEYDYWGGYSWIEIEADEENMEKILKEVRAIVDVGEERDVDDEEEM